MKIEPDQIPEETLPLTDAEGVVLSEADANGVHSSAPKLLSFLKKNVFVNFKDGNYAIGRPRLVNWVPDCPEVTKLQVGSTTFFLNDVTTFREV